MEAKETLLSWEGIRRVFQEQDKKGQHDNMFRMEALCEAQAEISFKAGMKQGIWLFAWWKDGVQYVGTSGRTLAEAYKELGIE